MSIGASAIRAGLAVVELGVDLGPMTAGLNQAATMLKGMSAKFIKAGVGVAGFGMSIAGPILTAFKGAVDSAAAMDTLATQLGLTADKASALSYSLGTVGIEEGELIGFSRRLAHEISACADGSQEAIQNFTKLGLSWQDLAKMDFAGQLFAVHGALGKINSDLASDRINAFNDRFGRRGLEMAKLSAEELKKRMKEAQDVGAVVTPEQAAAAKEIQRAYGQMGSAIKYAMLEIGRALLPEKESIKSFAKEVVGTAKMIRTIISGNKALVLGALAVGAAITAAGASLVAMGVIGASVAAIISGLTAAFGALAAVGGLALTPVGIAIAAVAVVVGGLALAYAHASEEQQKFLRTGFFGDVLDRWHQIATEGEKAWDVVRESAVAAWGGIASALKRGDLSTAWAIVMAEADVVWQQSKASFLSLWDDARDEFLDVASTMALGLEVSLIEAFAAIAKAFADLVGQITGRMASLLSALAGTRAAKLAGQSGNLQDLANKIGGVGGDDGGIAKWRQQKIEAAKIEFQRAKEARDDARDHDKEMRDNDVKMAREKLQGLLDEEERAAELDAALAARNAKGGGGGMGGLQQAAREVRGTFAGFSSAGAQQALAVGSTPVQRQLVDVNKQQLEVLQRIDENTKDGGPAFG